MNPLAALVAPTRAFSALADAPPPISQTMIWAALAGAAPPVCAFFGMIIFGWRLGVGAPLAISAKLAAAISVAYYVLLLGGFVAAAMMMRWMAPSYRAHAGLAAHAALLLAAGAPLMLGGIAHLYPLLEFNLMLLAPAMMWSMYLLYTGLPKVLRTDADSGMLMATSMLGVFFVAANALMFISIALWTLGLGPDIGFDWRMSVSG